MLILNHRPLSQMQRDVNRLFNAMFSEFPVPTAAPRAFAPAMNVWEDGPNYFIEAELPGFTMDELSIEVLDNEVTIKGERKAEQPKEGATWLRRERQHGSFTRAWTLPVGINADKVQATLTNGVLQVTLPKVEKALPRKIEVRGPKG